MSTPWAPFIAVSCTPLYPFCPRTSQICIAISTSSAGWPRLKLRFETFVPIVVMYSSENWSNTKPQIRAVQFVPESPESLLVLPGRDPVHARETVWSTRLSERNGLAEVPDLGQDEFLQVDFLLEVRPEVSNRLAIAQDDSISLQEFRIARDQRGNVRRFPHGPTEQASRILSEQPLDGRDVVARRPSESKVARRRALSRHGPIGSIERGEVDVPHLLVDPIPANVPTRREGGEPKSFPQEPIVS